MLNDLLTADNAQHEMNLTGTNELATPSWDAAIDTVATYQMNCGGYATAWMT